MEADETSTGQRKYQRGKRQRKAGAVWWSTVAQTKVSETGKRTAEKVKARLAPQRHKETLEKNLDEMVSSFAQLQTDCWKGYSGCSEIHENHQQVNHRKTFVTMNAQNEKVSVPRRGPPPTGIFFAKGVDVGKFLCWVLLQVLFNIASQKAVEEHEEPRDIGSVFLGDVQLPYSRNKEIYIEVFSAFSSRWIMFYALVSMRTVALRLSCDRC